MWEAWCSAPMGSPSALLSDFGQLPSPPLCPHPQEAELNCCPAAAQSRGLALGDNGDKQGCEGTLQSQQGCEPHPQRGLKSPQGFIQDTSQKAWC